MYNKFSYISQDKERSTSIYKNKNHIHLKFYFFKMKNNIKGNSGRY